MAMSMAEIESMIREALPDAKVEVRDWPATAITTPPRSSAPPSPARAVQQHQMVYAALQGRMGGVLHALALTTSAQ